MTKAPTKNPVFMRVSGTPFFLIMLIMLIMLTVRALRRHRRARDIMPVKKKAKDVATFPLQAKDKTGDRVGAFKSL